MLFETKINYNFMLVFFFVFQCLYPYLFYNFSAPSPLGSRIKRKKQVKTQLRAVPKAQTEILNKIREKFDIRQGPDPEIERGNLLRITPEGDFALLQPFNPLQHDYSPQIGPYTVTSFF